MAERKKPREERYHDFANVESMHNDIVVEDQPEGPYGSPIERPLGKSTPWEPGQKSNSGFAYENRSLHAGGGRKFPNAHPPHPDHGEGGDLQR